MESFDVNVVIAGAAGEGVQTIGAILSRAGAASGFGVFAWQEKESRIRGGNCSYAVRLASRPVNAPRLEADLLVALNPKAAGHYLPRCGKSCLLLTPEPLEDAPEGAVVLDFHRLSRDWFDDPLYAGTIALGAAGAALDLDPGVLEERVLSLFHGKSDEVRDTNAEALSRGLAEGKKALGGSPLALPGKEPAESFLLTGHDAVALGAARAGCRFMCAYPMSPSTGVITALAEGEKELGVFVEQVEDELCAVNMALGASFGGARAMTATSGGGFALMNEAMSLAGMTETPLVAVVAQRPGPATGLPTRTAQGDLLFCVFSGHGEYPKAVLAPADAGEAFDLTLRAFELSERFQIPVVLLTDQLLAESLYRVEGFDLDGPPVAPRGEKAETVEAPYRRYRLTKSGVSPRLFPGESTHLVAADSDEHDEAGHITEDLKGAALAMADKRLRKAAALKAAMEPPVYEGPEEAALVLVSFGTMKHPTAEALALLAAEGAPGVGHLHYRELWPLAPYGFDPAKRYVTVESNATAQLARLLRGESGVKFADSLLFYDGICPGGRETAEKARDLL